MVGLALKTENQSEERGVVEREPKKGTFFFFLERETMNVSKKKKKIGAVFFF